MTTLFGSINVAPAAHLARKGSQWDMSIGGHVEVITAKQPLIDDLICKFGCVGGEMLVCSTSATS
ncbi:MAG: hypothetical protein KUL88_15535 [Rhizobium sp.]|nr:hypothetical protein [Rhizobium sp.]